MVISLSICERQRNSACQVAVVLGDGSQVISVVHQSKRHQRVRLELSEREILPGYLVVRNVDEQARDAELGNPVDQRHHVVVVVHGLEVVSLAPN